jgi:2-polyprenyl-3-methyl-5-hydroxy-6-metoxy-1,4-benzoquinol methylase
MAAGGYFSHRTYRPVADSVPHRTAAVSHPADTVAVGLPTPGGSRDRGSAETAESGGTEAVFRWLDGADGSPLIQQVKRRMLDVCPVGEGDQVLDVGCGLGHEVRRLARLVGPQGRVVGIDANPAMITEAAS